MYNGQADYWWLRSPDHGGYYDYIAYVVYPDGGVDYDVNFDWNVKNSYGRNFYTKKKSPFALRILAPSALATTLRVLWIQMVTSATFGMSSIPTG